MTSRRVAIALIICLVQFCAVAVVYLGWDGVIDLFTKPEEVDLTGPVYSAAVELSLSERFVYGAIVGALAFVTFVPLFTNTFFNIFIRSSLWLTLSVQVYCALPCAVFWWLYVFGGATDVFITICVAYFGGGALAIVANRMISRRDTREKNRSIV